jgi:peptidoglycan/xylan/chitin deacetylase (PgdA/CDA1 family)
VTRATAAKAVKRAILHGCRLSGATALARAVTSDGFRIVGFHGVSIADEHERFPTLFISPDAFERRLRFLTRHYRVVPLEDAVEQHRTGRIRPNQVVLTFDDGFYNFLGRAVPLLRKHGVHATVYVVTADVESREPTYNLMVRDLVLSSPRTSARGLPHDPDRTVDLSHAAARDGVVPRIVEVLYGTCGTADDRLQFCRRLALALDVDIEPKLRARLWDRLTEQEVRAVADEGFGVQLHTHSHRNVIRFREQVRDEVRANRTALERMSARSAVHFCYPLGLWDREVWTDLAAEGVQSAVTTRNGPNYPQTPPLALRRQLTGEAMTDLEFEFEMSGLRWLARAAMSPGSRYEPSEKRVRYAEQPDLY